MLFDCHMHTTLCGHALGEPEAYVQAAAAQGIKLITFTCHTPANSDHFGGPGIRMDPHRLPEYATLVARAADYGRDHDVEVLLGIEAEVYYDESVLGEMDDALAQLPFDFVLGSLHHHCPGYTRMLASQYGDDDDARTIRYFEDLTNGVHTRRYDSIAHPDVIRDYGGLREFHPARHEALIRGFLQALLETGTAMEVNTSGLIKNSFEVHPHPLILRWAGEMNTPVTIGSDSHRPEHVGQEFAYAINLLRESGFQELRYYRQRQPQLVPLESIGS